MQPAIIFENEHFLAIDKPARWYTIAPRDSRAATSILFDWVKKVNPNALVVHRLDYETSGLVLFAKSKEAHRKLCQIFEERLVQKTYLALVHGIVGTPMLRLTEPIEGKKAVTKIHVVKSFRQANVTLVEAELHTGRRHQIRIHLSHAGYPILGDTRYGGAKVVRKIQVERVALHAAQIEFKPKHPWFGAKFEAALPEDFNAWVGQLS